VLRSSLPPKLGPAKRIPPTSFSNYLLESIWIELIIPYDMLPHHKKAKQNTIGITKGTSVKLPHHMGHLLAYPMKNETPLIHHTIEC
jgi:hypothetical protein